MSSRSELEYHLFREALLSNYFTFFTVLARSDIILLPTISLIIVCVPHERELQEHRKLVCLTHFWTASAYHSPWHRVTVSTLDPRTTQGLGALIPMSQKSAYNF